MSGNAFFIEDSVLDGVWSEYDFGTSMNGIHIINRGAGDIEFSFNGIEVHGKLLAADVAQSRDVIDEKVIYVRGAGGGADIQIEAWRGKR